MKRLPSPERYLVAAGLLLVTVPLLVNDWIPVPDFIRGALAGIGIGMEIIGLIRLRKKRKAGITGC